MNTCTTKPVEINGAVLTEEAIDLIKEFQLNNNDFINFVLETINESITTIGKTEPENKAEYIELIVSLSNLKTHLKKFRKP